MFLKMTNPFYKVKHKKRKTKKLRKKEESYSNQFPLPYLQNYNALKTHDLILVLIF